LKENHYLPKVFIVILNYKNWQDTVDCLESVFRSTYKNFQVIVVDNNSENGSIEQLIKWSQLNESLPSKILSLNTSKVQKPITYHLFHKKDINELSFKPEALPKLIFIQNDQNNGFASGNNLALKYLAREEAYIWLLNPDMVVEAEALSELVNCMQHEDTRVVMGTLVKSYDQPERIIFYGGGKINFITATVSLVKREDQIGQICYIGGGSLFTYASNFKDNGLLPENYFLYWEETDWCYAALVKGYKMKVCSKAICYDKISTTIGKGYLADYYYTRNGLLFVSKFKKSLVPLVLLFNLFRFLKRIIFAKWQRGIGVLNGTIDFLLNRF